MKLDKEGWQILLGSILGDGTLWLSKECKNVRYQESHSIKQEEYLRWKNKHFHFKITKPYYSTCQTGKKYQVITIWSKTSQKLTELYKKCYPNGKKRAIPLLKKIGALGLAVWFCDDGSYNYADKNVQIATCGFPDKQKIASWFKQKWNITSKISPQGRLLFSVGDTQKLFKTIKPYVLKMPQNIHYKIGLDFKKGKEKIKKKREYYKRYRQKPEVKKRMRRYKQRYRQKPEVKKKEKKYRQRIDIRERKKKYDKERYACQKLRK